MSAEQEPTPAPVQMEEQPKAAEVQPEQVQPVVDEAKAEVEKAVENKEEAAKVMDNQPQSAEEKARDLEKKASEARMEAEVEKLFNLADKDGNGSLNPTELRAFLLRHVKLSEAETEYLFDKFDKDDDQKIDKEEFKALLSCTSKIAVETAFDDISSNAGCLVCLNLIAICCCPCTMGLSCVPYCCYKRHLANSINAKIKDAIVEHAKS